MALLARQSGWTARTRIVAWLLLLVTVVLAANLLIATRVLLARTQSRLENELRHEYDKLAAFVERTGGDHRRVDALLDDYLASAVPEDDETYFTVIDGRPDRRSRNEPLARLDLDRDFIAAVAAPGEPRLGRFDSEAGEVRYGVFPVTVPGDERAAALVVAEFAEPERARTASVIWTLVLVSIGALTVAGVGAWLVAGRLLRPIRTVRETAETISESDLTRRIEVTGDDDVADLARTFNRMLDRVEAAFEVQRQFLDDAGHELRTPITVVRGQLEVMGDDPDERSRVVPLVTGELVRMGRIVDDLLVLARAERPDFLTVAPVDVADLTVEVVAKARTLGERHWSVSEVAHVVAVADEQRLTQALMQLVTNAVAHTTLGELIDVGSAWRGGDVLFWVRDSGSGIDEAEHDQIFDRFVTSSADDGPSTGLGLAIVRSIAEAHGGEVRLRSRRAEGATFTLVLPLKIVDSGTRRDSESDDDAGGGDVEAPIEDEPRSGPVDRSAV